MSTNWSWPSLVTACQLVIFFLLLFSFVVFLLGSVADGHYESIPLGISCHGALHCYVHMDSGVDHVVAPSAAAANPLCHVESLLCMLSQTLAPPCRAGRTHPPSFCPPRTSVSVAPPPVSAASSAHPQTLLLLRRWFPGPAGRTGKEGGDLGEGGVAVSRTKMCPGHHSPTSAPPPFIRVHTSRLQIMFVQNLFRIS